MNTGVLLAAGTSSRFGHPTPKQLCDLGGKTVVSHSVDLLSNTLDELIVVTNSECLLELKRQLPALPLVVNDVNCRIASIKAALDFLGKKTGTILIHDAARPFIQEEHVRTLLDAMSDHHHAQYYLKLINGLARRTATGYETVDRDEYLELVSPQITHYEVFSHVFRSYIQRSDRTVWEILEVCDKLDLEYKLFEGHHRHFRKITTAEDLYF